MNEDIGGRIRDARMRRGMTQEKLAASIGVEKWTISKIESGTRDVKSGELADIADALDVAMRDLLGTRKPLEPLALAHRLGDSDPDSPSANRATRHLRSLLEVHALLDELEIPEPIAPAPKIAEFTPGTTNPSEAGEELSTHVRDTLDLGNQPIVELDAFIEQWFRVDVIGFPLGDGEETISGMCVTTPGFRAALVNTSKWLTHQRFTLAHELAHILFDDPRDERHIDTVENMFDKTDPQEVRANAFAAEFLVPEDALSTWVETSGGLTESVFAHLLFTYRVSVPTLAFRLHNTDLIDARARDDLLELSPGALARKHNQMSVYREMRQERDHVRPPTRLYERALQAYCNARIGIGPLAGILDRDEDELRDELASEGFVPELEEDADVLAVL